MTFFSRMHQLRAPWMAWWLALALVVAPALGRMHEVLHAPGFPQTQVISHASTHDAHNAHDAHDWFGQHSALECLVFDQLGHGCNAAPAVALIAHTLPQTTPVWSMTPTALPAVLAVFEARAPPHGAA